MVIATALRGSSARLLLQPEDQLPACGGRGVFDGETRRFDAQTATAVLDWGRGVWTYRNTWYWGQRQRLRGWRALRMNLGYGFGDTAPPRRTCSFMMELRTSWTGWTSAFPGMPRARTTCWRPGNVTDNLGRLDLTFTPVLDRAAHRVRWCWKAISIRCSAASTAPPCSTTGECWTSAALAALPKGQKPLVMRRALACEIMEERNCENC